MLDIIVDNPEQCGQQGIVQCCFHQARAAIALAVNVYALDKATIAVQQLKSNNYK